MLNRKGQGLTEYGIILLLIVLMGSLIWFHNDVKGQLSTMYAAIGSNLKSVANGEATENYDTDETMTIAKTLVHFTSLTEAGNSQHRIAWFTDSSGQRVYFPYRDKNGLHDTTDLQGVHYNLKTEIGADGGQSTYFLATDGNYYKITDYSVKETTLTKYNGTPNQKYIRDV